MLTDSTAVRLSSGTKPALATCPDISAIPIGPPQLIGRFAAQHDVAEVAQCRVMMKYGSLTPSPSASNGPVALVLPFCAASRCADADHADAASCCRTGRKSRAAPASTLSVDRAPPRLHLEGQLLSALALTTRCMSLKRLDRLPVDGDDQVAGLEAGRGGRPVRHSSSTRGAVTCMPTTVKVTAKIDNRQQEIGDRPGRDDGRPRRQRLGLERARPLVRRHAAPARPATARWRCSRHPGT